MFTRAFIVLLSFSALLAEAGIVKNIPGFPGTLRRRYQHSLVKRSSSKSCTLKPSPTSSNNTASSTPTPGNGNNGKGGNGGVINVAPGKCGKPNGTTKIGGNSGPNGEESWLNCGVDGSGWTPPQVTPSDLVYVPLDQALQNSNSPFHACQPYLSYFKQYGDQYGIPDTILAAIALQESSCNPNSNAGTIGLMQISTDKCDVSISECWQPGNNIRIGTKYLADLLTKNNNNIVACMGQYNGWYGGMTVNDATKAASQGHCSWQQNLDYLQQFFNGWIQNQDAYGLNLGQYFNVNKCN